MTTASCAAILLEDDPFDREYATACLVKAGATVTTIDLGDSLQNALPIDPNSTIFLDVMLGPKQDAFTILDELAKASFQGNIVLLSGYRRDYLTMARNYGEAKGLNIVGVLEKPLDAQALIETIS